MRVCTRVALGCAGAGYRRKAGRGRCDCGLWRGQADRVVRKRPHVTRALLGIASERRARCSMQTWASCAGAHGRALRAVHALEGAARACWQGTLQQGICD